MPEPRTPCCPRRGSHSLTTWQPTYENTGQQGRNAGCSGPRTQNKPSGFAPPTYKNMRPNFRVCSDHERRKDWRTASFKTTMRRSRPQNRHQNNLGPNRGSVQGEQTPQPAGPNGLNRNRKGPQRHHRLIHNRSQRPKRAHSSRRRNVPPCPLNGQTAQKYRGCWGPRLEGNRIDLYGSGARYKADWPHLANMATCS